MTGGILKYGFSALKIDCNYRRTDLTQQVRDTSTHSTVMDQKELEDRMAAAEALSSLGCTSAFADLKPRLAALRSRAETVTPPMSENASKGRSKGRARKERGTGRESKSRSTRGRGRGSSTTTVATAGVTVGALNDFRTRAHVGLSAGLLLQESPGNHSVTHVQPPTLTLQGRPHGGNSASSRTHISQQPSQLLLNSASVSLQLKPAAPARSVLKNDAYLHETLATEPKSPVERPVVSKSIQMGYMSDIRQSGVLHLTLPTSTITTVSPQAVTTPTDSLLSLPSVFSLPNLTLDSSLLPNLPSVPNLPSLPSAIASLKLTPAASPDIISPTLSETQLSPLGRESDEKSLPLKKRKIFDPNQAESGFSQSSTNSMPSLQIVSLASSSNPTRSSSVNAAGVASQLKVPEVLSPVTSPSMLLSQFLTPALRVQLLSEINTAITPDDDGDLPLHIAVVQENELMVKKLIQLMTIVRRGVDRYNKQQQTPLHLAIKTAFLPAIKLLLDAGADPNLVDSSGSTSIHMAVQGQNQDSLTALLQWSKPACDLNYRNFEGLAPLHTAIINNDLEIVKKLLDHGADINIMDGKSGRTVLFHAAEANQKLAVELLLKNFADPDITNYAGVTPAMAAQGRNHTNVARMLSRTVEEGSENISVEDMEVDALEIDVSDNCPDTPRTSDSEKSRIGSIMFSAQSPVEAGISTLPILNKSPLSPSGGIVLKASSGQTVTPLQLIRTRSISTEERDLNALQNSATWKASLAPLATEVGNASEKNPDDPKPVESNVSSTSSIANVMTLVQNMFRVLSDRQNSGQRNLSLNPFPPSVSPLSVADLSNNSSIISSVSLSGEPSILSPSLTRLVILPGVVSSRVAPLPSVTLPLVTSPTVSVRNVNSPVALSTPSAAHSQPARPLVFFRSSAAESAERQFSSIEVRHVSPEAFAALKKAQEKVVMENLKAAPGNLQILQNLVMSSQIPGSVKGDEYFSHCASPPISNHVSPSEGQSGQLFCGAKNRMDQPEDYSLKSKKDSSETAKLCEKVETSPKSLISVNLQQQKSSNVSQERKSDVHNKQFERKDKISGKIKVRKELIGNVIVLPQTKVMEDVEHSKYILPQSKMRPEKPEKVADSGSKICTSPSEFNSDAEKIRAADRQQNANTETCSTWRNEKSVETG